MQSKHCLLISGTVIFTLWCYCSSTFTRATELGNLLPWFLGLACGSSLQRVKCLSQQTKIRGKLLCCICLAQRQAVRSVRVFLVIKFWKGFESLYLYWVTLRPEITNVWFFSSMDFEINAYFCSSSALVFLKCSFKASLACNSLWDVFIHCWQ